MKLPNGYGSVVKLSGKRRKPYMVRKTTGYHIDPVKEKKVADYIIIGYTATKQKVCRCWQITIIIHMIPEPQK